MTSIRMYIEGSSELRRGFSELFSEIRNSARRQGLRWEIILCGSRNSTIEDFFKKALPAHPDAFNVLLVDSEGPVRTQSPWDHLKQQPGVTEIKGKLQDEHCHLMVQAMEAWFIADVDALSQFYGQNFNKSAIPNNQNVEQINHDRIVSDLKSATRKTQKGAYHKTRHAPHLLAKIRLENVRNRAPSCDRLVQTLLGRID